MYRNGRGAHACTGYIPGEDSSDLLQLQRLEGTGEEGSTVPSFCILVLLGKAKYALKLKK